MSGWRTKILIAAGFVTGGLVFEATDHFGWPFFKRRFDRALKLNDKRRLAEYRRTLDFFLQ